MYLGLPVIGCADQVPDLITHKKDGFLTDPHDIDQITECWEQLINSHDLRRSIGKEAQKTIQKGFTWEKTSQEYDKAFKKSLEL
jgi:glycosyltransferase involved in cell wall biosynthesis